MNQRQCFKGFCDATVFALLAIAFRNVNVGPLLLGVIALALILAAMLARVRYCNLTFEQKHLGDKIGHERAGYFFAWLSLFNAIRVCFIPSHSIAMTIVVLVGMTAILWWGAVHHLAKAKNLKSMD